MARALAAQGMTLPQFSVLTMLQAYPGASGAELARLSLLTAQTMNVIVGNLERDGRVFRRPDPAHGRIQLIEPTPAGKALLAKCKAAVQQVEAALLANVTPEAEQVRRHWLVQVAMSAL